METPTFPSSGHDTETFEVSPVLETGSPTPLSTHWIPLHELVAHWTRLGPLLTAIGHALFALSRETRALHLYTLAWEKRQWHAPTTETDGLDTLVVWHLHEAAHHWSRAAFSLDSLLPSDLDPAALARARRLSRIARTQQERLWKLTEEVGAEREASRAQQQKQDKHPCGRR